MVTSTDAVKDLVGSLLMRDSASAHEKIRLMCESIVKSNTALIENAMFQYFMGDTHDANNI
jgi:hypothetical protein